MLSTGKDYQMQALASNKAQVINFALALLVVNLSPAAAAQDLAAALQQMANECRAVRSECYSACVKPARNLARGREASDADIEACRNAHAELGPKAPPEPTWIPEYAQMPDVVGVFRGALVAAQGRNDWKRYCQSSAIVGEASASGQWNIPKGATVRVSGIRYVTNPVRSLDKRKTACLADSVELLSGP
jgi:hypothetical protein